MRPVRCTACNLHYTSLHRSTPQSASDAADRCGCHISKPLTKCRVPVTAAAWASPLCQPCAVCRLHQLGAADHPAADTQAACRCGCCYRAACAAADQGIDILSSLCQRIERLVNCAWKEARAVSTSSAWPAMRPQHLQQSRALSSSSISAKSMPSMVHSSH